MFLEPLVWICDHGAAPSIHRFGNLSEDDDDDDDEEGEGVRMPHNFGAVFAGPDGRTADDVVVDLVGLRCGLVRGSDVDADDGVGSLDVSVCNYFREGGGAVVLENIKSIYIGDRRRRNNKV